MAKTIKSKQLTFSLPNKIGLLSDVAEAVAEAKVNIEAICAYERGYGFFMMVADDAAKAKKILTRMGANVHVEDVILLQVPNRVGQLEKISKKISDAGINVIFIYGSPGKGKTATLVLHTANDRKTMKLLEK
jgi:hypothetical protein